MSTGRNEPCPCGSGKKYKSCCLPLEQKAGGKILPGAIRFAAKSDEAWEIDYFPLPGAIADRATERPVIRLVCSQGFVLDTDVLLQPLNEAEEVAADFEKAVATLRARFGATPRELRVRDAELANLLSRRFSSLELTVQQSDELPGLALAAESLLQNMGLSREMHRISTALTWTSWGHPSTWIERIFRAAAVLYRCAPWEVFEDAEVIAITTPNGKIWLAVLMGGAGIEFGIALYEREADLRCLFDSAPEEAVAKTRGRALSLLFDAEKELPKPMRQEIRRAGWEVAGARAYPHLMTTNTLAGGLSAAEAEVLASVLEAIPRYLTAFNGSAEPWHDAETGLTLALAPGFEEEVAWDDNTDPIHGDSLALTPGGAQGSGARPDAAVEFAVRDEPDFEALERSYQQLLNEFGEALERSGVAMKAVQAFLGDASLLADFLCTYQGTPIAAMHEFDLRVFLYDWAPRKVSMSRTDASAVLDATTRFLNFVSEREAVELPWARVLLADRERFIAQWSPPSKKRAAQSEVSPYFELEQRLMLHRQRLAGRSTWGKLMGRNEASLERELQRRWLTWREELLAAGVPDRRTLAEELAKRQHAWETSPHPGRGGLVPFDEIQKEREAMAARNPRDPRRRR